MGLEAETDREGPGREREARTASMSAGISEVGQISNRSSRAGQIAIGRKQGCGIGGSWMRLDSLAALRVRGWRPSGAIVLSNLDKRVSSWPRMPVSCISRISG